MEYQKNKFARTKNWVEINDESRGTYDEVNQIRFKNLMLRSSLCDYSDAYVLVKGIITAINTAAQNQPNNGANRKVIFKNWAPLINCISRINNTQVDDAHDIDEVMSMYNLIEFSDNYSKTSGVLPQYYRDESALDDNDTIGHFAEVLLLIHLK